MHELLAKAAEFALALGEAELFIEAFSQQIPRLLPGALPPDLDEVERRCAMRGLARQLWNLIPLPENELRSRPLPAPERNGLCSCGSGRKYKQCCLPLEKAVGGASIQASLLPYVMDCLPQKQLDTLPAKRVREPDMAEVAARWLDEGEFQRVRKLLEPAYDVAALHDRHAWMYRCLDDAYRGLDMPRKRVQLQAQTLAAPSRVLRAEALQHRVTQLADQGDFPAAWAAFHEAMRLNPQDPHLSHLEVLTLLSEGKSELAAERLKYWKQRLRRDWGHEHDDLIELMEQMIAAPGILPFALACAEEPELGELAELLRPLPEPVLHYTLRGDEEMAEMAADAKLKKLEKQWCKLFPQSKPSLTHLQLEWHDAAEGDFEPWLRWLVANPQAFDSFEVLDDLLLLLTSLDVPLEAIDLPLLGPLVERVHTLWRLLFARNIQYAGTIPWVIHENRPALRALAQKLFWLELGMERGEAHDAEYDELLHLFLRLNPNDNHGYRELASDRLLKRGEAAEARALHEGYPEDGPHLGYNGVLALWLLGDMEQAAERARTLSAQYPEVAKMLLAKNPRKPALNPGWVSHGGKDQAWFYREAMRPVWEASSGALEWLRKQK